MMFEKIQPVMRALSAKTRLSASTLEDQACHTLAKQFLKKGPAIREEKVAQQRTLIQKGNGQRRDAIDAVVDVLIDEINGNKR